MATFNSKIEQDIDELEEYIRNCKGKFLSSSEIIVNRDTLIEYLSELRMHTPDEIKHYKKLVANKEQILADANERAQQIISNAQITRDELVSEHQIMQQAYDKANEIVTAATQEAQGILDQAVLESNNIKTSAIEYTDNELKNLETIIGAAIDMTRGRTENLINDLGQVLNVISSNRAQLAPSDAASQPAGNASSDQVDADLDAQIKSEMGY